jgi:hypothetical protein
VSFSSRVIVYGRSIKCITLDSHGSLPLTAWHFIIVGTVFAAPRPNFLHRRRTVHLLTMRMAMFIFPIVLDEIDEFGAHYLTVMTSSFPLTLLQRLDAAPHTSLSHSALLNFLGRNLSFPPAHSPLENSQLLLIHHCPLTDDIAVVMVSHQLPRTLSKDQIRDVYEMI